MRDEYTFVTLDNDMVTTGDAVFVDLDEAAHSERDFVRIDDSHLQFDASSNYLILDDMDYANDMDIDSYASDICEADVTIIL